MAEFVRVQHLGHDAIDVDSSLRLGDYVRASSVRRLDGSVPNPGDLMECGTCGAVLRLKPGGPTGFIAYSVEDKLAGEPA